VGDTILLEGLEVCAFIGVTEEERRERQTLVIDLEFETDAPRAAATDDIEDALNYRTVAKAVLAFAEESRCQLVETFAERVATLVRERFGVPWLRVEVRKPGAIRFARSVGIRIERGRRGR
jgi:dihydroneopterin aldolase